MALSDQSESARLDAELREVRSTLLKATSEVPRLMAALEKIAHPDPLTTRRDMIETARAALRLASDEERA